MTDSSWVHTPDCSTDRLLALMSADGVDPKRLAAVRRFIEAPETPGDYRQVHKTWTQRSTR